MERAKDTHMYVVRDYENIVGYSSIAAYWSSKTKSILLTIFLLPEYQNKGVERKIN